MHYGTQNNDVSLARKLQHHIYMKHQKHGVIDQSKYRKRCSEIKWTYREYHVKYNPDVSHKEVKIYCKTNELPELPFCGPHPKPHSARGFSKHHYSCFDPKIGHGICAISNIPYACVPCTSMLDQR